MKTLGKMKSCFGSSVPASGPSQRAQTEHFELGWWMFRHLPPSVRFPVAVRVKDPGVWEQGRLHTHKQAYTPQRLSRQPGNPLETSFFFLSFFVLCLSFVIQLQPGNYAALSCHAGSFVMLTTYIVIGNHVIPYRRWGAFPGCCGRVKRKSWCELIYVNVKLFILLNYSPD